MEKIKQIVQIKLSEEELEKLEKIKKDLGFKTSAGLLRYLITIATKEIENRG